LETTGDVSKLDTRTDSKGRRQQAHKPVADKPRDSADDAGGRVVVDRAEPVREPRFGEFRNSKGKIKSSCDFNPEDADDVAEPGDSDEVIRHRIFLNHASEALRHARAVASLRQKAAPQEITDDIFETAYQAAEAWSELIEVLDPVKFVLRSIDELDGQTRDALFDEFSKKWPDEFGCWWREVKAKRKAKAKRDAHRDFSDNLRRT
jgi:hypothetical protein